MIRASFRRAFAAAISLVLLSSGCATTNAPETNTPVVGTRIPLYPNRPDERRAGQLLYRGGLELTSKDPRFGGWSDIAVNEDGSAILAVSDQAHWLRARLRYDASGDLAGLSDGHVADMIGMDGMPMQGKEGDAEGMTLEHAHDLDGGVLVSFERYVRVWRYDLKNGLGARPSNVPIGPWVNALHDNRQLEAIALTRPDTLLAIAETKVNDGDDILAAFEGYPGGPRLLSTRMTAVVPHDPFAVTSAAAAPNGDVFLLERRFSLAGGGGIEMRRIPASEVRPGARMDGEVVVNLAYQDANIDNMEGLALRRGPNGETLLYMISDNNYSSLQRTLLLMFELRER